MCKFSYIKMIFLSHYSVDKGVMWQIFEMWWWGINRGIHEAWSNPVMDWLNTRIKRFCFRVRQSCRGVYFPDHENELNEISNCYLFAMLYYHCLLDSFVKRWSPYNTFANRFAFEAYAILPLLGSSLWRAFNHGKTRVEGKERKSFLHEWLLKIQFYNHW